MAKKKAPAAAPTAVDAITHSASRTNIPTRETAAFASDAPPPQVTYPRDPSLDPQLVWKGKDAQDSRGALTVPAVAIHVQEKVHPRALIDDILARAAAGKPRPVDLFADFNGLDDFQKKLDFYQHHLHWTNRLILGDSLLVMASLAERERLRGQVQCVYFDPPYGIKFGSNWQVSTRKRDVKDAKAEDLTRQPEQIKAFRDTWELGIHSYLTYLRDRLAAARDLLTESGSIFVQIGDENVHLVRCLMDEVFGSGNSVGVITFAKTSGLVSNYLASVNDFLLWYAKDIKQLKFRQPYLEKSYEAGTATNYSWVELPDGTRRTMNASERDDPSRLPADSRIFRPSDLTSQGNPEVAYTHLGKTYRQRWKTTVGGLTKLGMTQRLHVTENTLRYTMYLDDFPCLPVTRKWDDTATGNFTDPKTYVVQTGTKTIQRCLLMTTDPGDLVLDPTCGSGTTAYVAEQWGRRWITIDTSRVAVALARTRLMAAKYPYYLLADSPAGRKKQRELDPLANDSSPASSDGDRTPDIARGFVYKTVPHVTLKSIANNPDIREGMTREQIDAAIRKHADTETLFDQPYEDKGTVRVCGPFTVESLSPHNELPNPAGIEADAEPATKRDPGQYLQTVFANLRVAGVKGTAKQDRIQFERLDPYPGAFVQAEGTTTAGLGVRVSVGPELGTVGDRWIAEAAKEAMKGTPPELLLVCGFSFEAGVLEQTAALTKEIKLGKLRILPVRMNPDLAMFGDETGKELLKKTGSANLFTVFGEPDIDLKKDKKSGQFTVTIHGLDVFDPTTGEVRTGGTDDIACWFLDTDYDGESFFVRHAYFCGADEPFEKLKKALRAEIDEGEWAKLYATASVPFDPPKSGKIAVKVVNHFGDEVLKVYPVGG